MFSVKRSAVSEFRFSPVYQKNIDFKIESGKIKKVHIFL